MRQNKLHNFINKNEPLKSISNLIIPFLILLIGIFFRLYRVASVPFGLNHDAALNGLAAIDLWNKLPEYLPFYYGWVGETFYHYYLGLIFYLFGANAFNLRLASVIIGILTLPIFYLLARRLQNRLSATLSLFFLAISGWHIVMSKVGWLMILVPLTQCLFFLFFYLALTKNSIKFWILSGITLALTLNTYGAGRITIAIFLTILIFWMLKNKSKVKSILSKLIIFSLVFIIFIYPLFNFAIHNWESYNSRADFLFVGNKIKQTNSLTPLIDNLKMSFGILHSRANGNDFFVDEPLLEKIPGYLFFLGLIYLIFNLKKLESFFILSWFILGFIPGLLSVPNGNHNFAILTPLYLIIGQGLASIIVFLKKITAKYFKFGYIILVLIMVFSTIDVYNQYLSPFRREIWGFYPETTIVANFMNKNKGKFEYYLTDNYPRDALTFLTYSGGEPFHKNYTWLEKPEDFFTIKQTPEKGLMFFMMDNSQNIQIRNNLLLKFPNSYFENIFYADDHINRNASVVVVVPSK
ncbi:MAG: glycosyltransferase family 39 protein [bacterium]|nr:glycosyltransferase family 39 protein [bacterium]